MRVSTCIPVYSVERCTMSYYSSWNPPQGGREKSKMVAIIRASPRKCSLEEPNRSFIFLNTINIIF
jgi:hypothetical protein